MNRQPLLLVTDRARAVEMFPDHDPGLGEAAAGRAGEDLEQVLTELHGIVVGHGALVGEAADVVEDLLGRQWAIRGGRVRRSAGKARIVARKESRQDGVGVLERSGPRTAEFADEAILEGASEALDAAFTRYEIVRCVLPCRCRHDATVIW